MLIPPLGLVYVGGAWLWVKWRSARTQAALARTLNHPATAATP